MATFSKDSFIPNCMPVYPGARIPRDAPNGQGSFIPYHMPVYPGALPGTNWAPSGDCPVSPFTYSTAPEMGMGIFIENEAVRGGQRKRPQSLMISNRPSPGFRVSLRRYLSSSTKLI